MRILAVILILALPFLLGFERDVTFEFEGRVEKESELVSGETATIVAVDGHGKVRSAEETTADGVSQERVVSMGVEGEADPVVGSYRRSMETIAGAKARAGGHYVTRVETFGGETGELSMVADVSSDYLDMLKLAQITEGVYERNIELAREDITLSEVMKVIGSGELEDNLRFDFDEAEDE